MKNIIATFALLTILVCLIWTSQLSEINTQISLLISVILAIASSAVSWIVAYSYSKSSLTKENSEIIDRIGEQSSEKILNQSKQLYSIEQYLDDKHDKLEDRDYDIEALIYLESTRNMLRLIRSSNNTYLSDWAGVVSKDVKCKIKEQSNAQSQLFEDIDLIHYSTPENREKLEEKIEENSSKLPSHLVPKKANFKINNARITNHEIIEDTENKKKGKVTILLSEESYKGHVVAKFANNFRSPPTNSSYSLRKSPNGEMNMSGFAKTGTTYDFHIVIKSDVLNVPLKEGIYEVEYEFNLEE